MKDKEVLKLALEALEDAQYFIEAELNDRMDLYKNYPNLAHKYAGEQESLRKNQEAITTIKEALNSPNGEAQPEQGYTTKRNVWTGNATHKCNVCGRDDFRSEHAAKFHKCEAVEEPKPHSQDKWLDIQLPDTTPPQRKD